MKSLLPGQIFLVPASRYTTLYWDQLAWKDLDGIFYWFFYDGIYENWRECPYSEEGFFEFIDDEWHLEEGVLIDL